MSTRLELGLGCIIAVAMRDNVGSCRVMEKAGMRYQGLADYWWLRMNSRTSGWLALM